MKLKRLLLTLTALLWLAGSAHAATTTLGASATIQTATITLTTVQPLNFGTIVATGVCNILVDAKTDGAAATSAVSSGSASITVAGSPGIVTVQSPVSATVTVAYSIASTTGAVADQIDNGGGQTMALTGASITTNSTASAGSLALTAGVASTLYVGGILQIGAAQTAGTYTGVITVAVNY